MARHKTDALSIPVNDATIVSGILTVPSNAHSCLIFAHGAGAGMRHSFMETVASELVPRRIATLRFQFPYMESGTRRPDPPPLAHATVRAAVAKARSMVPRLPLIAGGKSFGGRMTSEAQAKIPLDGVKGLVFFGFPLHPAGKPSAKRAQHLFEVTVPMLFLQGSRDALAELTLLEPLVHRLGSRATLEVFADADHSFHVPARSGRKDQEVLAELLDFFARWIEKLI